MPRRVVITGVGLVAPNGVGNEACWEGMVGGVSAIRRVTEFDVSQFNTKIAAQVSDFDPFTLGLSRDEVLRMDRYVQFAMVTARMAIEDAKLDLEKIDHFLSHFYVAFASITYSMCGAIISLI